MYDVIALGELLVDLAERAKDENGYQIGRAHV